MNIMNIFGKNGKAKVFVLSNKGDAPVVEKSLAGQEFPVMYWQQKRIFKS